MYKMDFKKGPSADFKNIRDITRQEAREEVAALREGIEYHNYLYYIKNNPVISDALYDQLLRRLQDLEQTFPELQSDTSPTRKVGAEPVSELKKVKHARPMLSLNASLDQDEVARFHDFVCRNASGQKVEYVLEPKLDGFSIEAVYERGIFQYGATRGNGDTGEDISENLKTIGPFPMRLQGKGFPPFLSVRGEVFMYKQGFQQLNKERVQGGEAPFANPRNASAGMMRQLDPKKVAGKPFNIYFYDILAAEGENFSSHWEALKVFPEWGFNTNPLNKKVSSMEKILEYHQKLWEQRDELSYEIDGIVIKLDSYGLREALGTRHRSPRWAFAWKFVPKKEITTLNDIVVQVGRTGMLTPVALLDPVDVGGVTVSRATLHNEDEAKRKDVRPGDRVRIVRAGDVIPEVVERIEDKPRRRGRPFSMPAKCPSCGAPVQREGAYCFCPAGISCPAQLIGHVVHYASRNAMDISGLGDKTAKDLVRKGLVRNIAGLYRLSVEDLLQLEGFAKKSATQLYEAVQGTKEPRLDRFLYALGIRHVGERVAEILARRLKTLSRTRSTDTEEINQIPDLGPEIARSVYKFFRTKENVQVLDELEQVGVKIQDMPEKEGEMPLAGKTFVFTGRLDQYTREQAKEYVESLGGQATSSLSGSTDYLVCGDGPGSKVRDAKKHNVRVLNENEFRDLIGKQH